MVGARFLTCSQKKNWTLFELFELVWRVVGRYLLLILESSERYLREVLDIDIGNMGKPE